MPCDSASPAGTIFLDRDGVINEEIPGYVKHWSEFAFLPGALEGLRLLHKNGFRTLVVTNQSCVGRGIISAHRLEEIHRRMRHEIEKAGGRIHAVYACLCHPDAGCSCRKPQPGLLLRAARDFDLDLSRCVFVGDAATDLQAGRTAGCRTLLVLTGKGLRTLREIRTGDIPPPHALAGTLRGAARIIVGRRAGLV